jgi:hypothetical protein
VGNYVGFVGMTRRLRLVTGTDIVDARPSEYVVS